jgi:hypothetical protein
MVMGLIRIELEMFIKDSLIYLVFY